MKKFFATFLCLVLCGGLLPAQAAGPEVNAKAVLLMEKTTGQVLYEEHAHDPLELASVTKVMTMLLIMEALEEGTITKETMVPVSATAAGMGGSQVYMKEGESFSVHDMLKAIAVASGNDACVAMAEYLAGSESTFVEKMNARAAELGMENTVFVNCTGLPAEGHHSSAYDIALMSRALIQNHPDIRTYTTIWMDTLRDGTFQLANTNKLSRFYEGATPIPVTLGTADSVQPVLTQESQILLPKAEAGKVSTTLSLPDTLQAPVEKGQELGSLTVLVDGKENQKLPLVAQEEVPRLTLWAVYQSLLGTLFCGT